MAQLKKHCPACSATDLHSRAAECKHCGFVFYIKKGADVSADWRTLEIGSTVKSVRGAGPYATVIRNGQRERVSYGSFGDFVINEIVDDGLWVREIRALAFGGKAIPTGVTGRDIFVYMSEPRPGVTGVIRQAPHKLTFLLNRKDTEKRILRGRG